jgi:hypothetical protein
MFGCGYVETSGARAMMTVKFRPFRRPKQVVALATTIAHLIAKATIFSNAEYGVAREETSKLPGRNCHPKTHDPSAR